MSKSNWPFGTDLSHPNFTGITKRECCGYAPGSETPPWGWPVTIVVAVSLVCLFLYVPTFLVRMFS